MLPKHGIPCKKFMNKETKKVKKTKKILAVVLCAAMLLCGTSITSFAADNSEEMNNILGAAADWLEALLNYDTEDFNGFVTAVLKLFGFQGSFEGVHSMPDLMQEWTTWFGPITDWYNSFINSIDTSQLVAIINALLGGFAG